MNKKVNIKRRKKVTANMYAANGDKFIVKLIKKQD